MNIKTNGNELAEMEKNWKELAWTGKKKENELKAFPQIGLAGRNYAKVWSNHVELRSFPSVEKVGKRKQMFEMNLEYISHLMWNEMSYKKVLCRALSVRNRDNGGLGQTISKQVIGYINEKDLSDPHSIY